jgi:hypothetical protein
MTNRILKYLYFSPFVAEEDSNFRPKAYEASELTTALSRNIFLFTLVALTRVELVSYPYEGYVLIRWTIAQYMFNTSI